MKLVMHTIPASTKCKLCDKIETKTRRRAAEQDRVKRWQRDGGKFRASIEKSQETIGILNKEIYTLTSERQMKLQAITNR